MILRTNFKQWHSVSIPSGLVYKQQLYHGSRKPMVTDSLTLLCLVTICDICITRKKYLAFSIVLQNSIMSVRQYYRGRLPSATRYLVSPIWLKHKQKLLHSANNTFNQMVMSHQSDAYRRDVSPAQFHWHSFILLLKGWWYICQYLLFH